MEDNRNNKFMKPAIELATLLDEKNKAYGNSFAQGGEFLKLLFPNGIPVESYTDMLCIVRIFDKLKRIATDKSAYAESPYRDMAGYAILGLLKDTENQSVEQSKQLSLDLDIKKENKEGKNK